MAISPEVLNRQVDSTDLKTGVYQSHERRCVVVVKADRKTGKVYYLKSEDATVTLETSWREKFVRDYPLHLDNYPLLRAVRGLARHIHEGFGYTHEAGAVIRAILKK